MLYADDIFIVSLSSSGLQHLLNICSDYCVRHDLTFNAKKSMCMYFSTPINKHCGLPVIYLFFFLFFLKKKKKKKKLKRHLLVDMCGVEGKRRLCDLNVTSSSPALATRHIRIVLLVNTAVR